MAYESEVYDRAKVIKTAIIRAFSAFLQNPKIRVRKVH